VQVQRKNDLIDMEKHEEKEFIECWKDKMKSLVRKKYNKLILI
jgi:hypothetical protein